MGWKHNLVSAGGVLVIMGLAWCMSRDRRRINWRLLGWGIALQMLFALFLFHVPVGVKLFQGLNTVVVRLLDAATAGTEFLFGRLSLAPGATNAQGETSLGMILAVQIFPPIVFFSSLVAVLYYLRLMPLVIRLFSVVFARLMRLSGAESLVAASNIFVGVESSLTVKPHLRKMTESEFCTVLTVGMATVASNVLAFYVFLLKEPFPAIAGHLISASFLSAPAALMLSKLMVPETGEPVTLGLSVKPHYERESSLFEAIINGANSGVRLVVGIAALLIAVLGLVRLVDICLGPLNQHLSVMDLTGKPVDWSVAGLLEYPFWFLTAILGVPAEDIPEVARLLGIRAIQTEVPAYQALAGLTATGAIARRSTVIATYALCGFAHVASMSIFVGGLTALVPERRADIARVGFRALIAATLACLMTACIAGMFYSDGVDAVLLGQ